MSNPEPVRGATAATAAGVALLVALTAFSFWVSRHDAAQLNARRAEVADGARLPDIPTPKGRTGGPQDGE